VRQDKKGSYRENIVHMTGALPYSVHRSFFGERDTQALYLHWHPEMELYYLEAGTVKFVVEDRSFIVCAGEAVFVPGNLLHGATSLENRGGSFRALVFSGDLIADTEEERTVVWQRQDLLRSSGSSFTTDAFRRQQQNSGRRICRR